MESVYLFKYKLTKTIISKIAKTRVVNVFVLDITFSNSIKSSYLIWSESEISGPKNSLDFEFILV